MLLSKRFLEHCLYDGRGSATFPGKFVIRASYFGIWLYINFCVCLRACMCVCLCACVQEWVKRSEMNAQL